VRRFESPKTQNPELRTHNLEPRLAVPFFSPLSSGDSELPFSLALEYSDNRRIRRDMITPDILTEYVRKVMPDAVVTVSDRTGTMDHLKVVVTSAAFAGKSLLDRHRLVYQSLDAPMKDGRIHALEITARTTEES
jgi:stress-induced morphogen